MADNSPPITIDELSIQAGRETVWGTSVAPTVKLMGVKDFSATPLVDGKVFQDRRGTLTPGHESATTKVGGEGSLELISSYEDLPYCLDSMFARATPVAGTPNTTYLRSYTAPLARPTTRYNSFYYGASGRAYLATGAMFSGLTFAFEDGEEVTTSGDWVAKRIVTDGGAFSNSLVDRAYTAIMGDHITIYLDAWGGTIGSTALTTTSFSAELAIKANRNVMYGLGGLAGQEWYDRPWSGELKMTMEFRALAQGYMNAILDVETNGMWQKQVRIAAVKGDNFVNWDFAGVSLKAPELFTDNDGVATLEFTLTAKHNPTLGSWLKVASQNAVALLA